MLKRIARQWRAWRHAREVARALRLLRSLEPISVDREEAAFAVERYMRARGPL